MLPNFCVCSSDSRWIYLIWRYFVKKNQVLESLENMKWTTKHKTLFISTLCLSLNSSMSSLLQTKYCKFNPAWFDYWWLLLLTFDFCSVLFPLLTPPNRSGLCRLLLQINVIPDMFWSTKVRHDMRSRNLHFRLLSWLLRSIIILIINRDAARTVLLHSRYE